MTRKSERDREREGKIKTGNTKEKEREIKENKHTPNIFQVSLKASG